MSDNSVYENPEVEETIIDIDTSDAQEPTVVEPGEYLIRITGFRKDANGKVVRTAPETGNRYFIVTFDIPNEEFSKGFSKIFSLPTEDMEPKRQNAIKWGLEEFKRAFGLVDLNFNDMLFKEGYAILRVTESEQYGRQNDIAKFIVGA